ncbi:hypothetical protein VPH35_002269 [Triticum aestivum]
MEAQAWLLLPVALLLPLVIVLLAQRVAGKAKNGSRIPPGPLALPLLGSLLWLRHSSADVEPLLRRLMARPGPVVSLRVGSRLSIFVADRRVAHAALVGRGAALADRPAVTRGLLGETGNTVARASCGATSCRRRCTRRASASSRRRAPGCAVCLRTSCCGSPAPAPAWRRRPAGSWSRRRSGTPCSASSCSCALARGSTRPRCGRSAPRSATGSCTSRARRVSSPSGRLSPSTCFAAVSRGASPCAGGRRSSSCR